MRAPGKVLQTCGVYRSPGVSALVRETRNRSDENADGNGRDIASGANDRPHEPPADGKVAAVRAGGVFRSGHVDAAGFYGLGFRENVVREGIGLPEADVPLHFILRRWINRVLG